MMKYALSVLFVLIGINVTAQFHYNEEIKSNKFPVYKVDKLNLPDIKEGKKPKSIILLIGDGMGIAQIQAGMTVNKGLLYLNYFKNTGFSKTYSADNYITDSAAGGTALSSGYKTKNGMIAMTPDSVPVETILEIAEKLGKSTGLVSTSSITHATPASFIAHQVSRNMYEDIAADFMNTDFEVILGGGYDNFAKRKDGRNLLEKFKDEGYQVMTNMDEIENVKDGKLVGLTATGHNPPFDERGDMLPRAAETAIDILDNNKKGFFLMVEGSQIDWGGHANNTDYIVGEMLDFDYTIGEALKFAAKDKNTLVIITADHETGGMAIAGGSYSEGEIQAAYTTKSHTGVMVPVFAWGPGSEEFRGIMDNTEIFKKMKELITHQ
ncbi:alkaline phosphatase [Saccharicrinis sp. FJH62]|uniref:alkaline phosphatase n=1 Tax=Saccharicrinis sp. FJH62 TaxID=3344657 RepID=UPI0035D522DB